MIDAPWMVQCPRGFQRGWLHFSIHEAVPFCIRATQPQWAAQLRRPRTGWRLNSRSVKIKVMSPHYAPGWLAATANPQRSRQHAGYFRKRSGSFAMLAAMRCASSRVKRFIDICRCGSSSK